MRIGQIWLKKDFRKLTDFLSKGSDYCIPGKVNPKFERERDPVIKVEFFTSTNLGGTGTVIFSFTFYNKFDETCQFFP